MCVALGNVGTTDDVPALQGALGDDAALVRGHAAWAVAEIAVRESLAGVVTDSLLNRLAVESDAWVMEELQAALDTISTR